MINKYQLYFESRRATGFGHAALRALLRHLEGTHYRIISRDDFVWGESDEDNYWSVSNPDEIDHVDLARAEIVDLWQRHAPDRLPGAKAGLYVHVLNRLPVWTQDAVTKAVDALMACSGEVCASDIGDQQFSIRAQTIGVILQGQPTASFNYDCWSFVVASRGPYAGLRVPGEKIGDGERSEHWLVPTRCKIWGLTAKGRQAEAWTRQLADQNGLCWLHYDLINDWEEKGEQS